jgi:CheY-like chemotaxis protein
VRILVVDDHRNTLIAMSIGLRRSGHSTVMAAGADDAVASLGASQFDCAICDVRMQPIGGLELARTIRQRWPSLPIVFMTAYDLSAVEKALAIDLGAPCLLKPISVEILLEMIAAVTH